MASKMGLAMIAGCLGDLRPADAQSISFCFQGDDYFTCHIHAPGRSGYGVGTTASEAHAAAIAAWEARATVAPIIHRNSDDGAARPSCLTIVQDGPDAE